MKKFIVILPLLLFLNGCTPCNKDVQKIDDGKVIAIYYQQRSWGAREKWTVVTTTQTFTTTDVPDYIVGDQLQKTITTCAQFSN